MNRDALITSLVAGFTTSRDVSIPLLDEDFAPDPSGDWMKYDGSWNSATSIKAMNAIMNGAFGIKTWTGPTPSWVIKDIDRHKAFCNDIDRLPRHSIITTYEHRIIRFATKRADEILSAQ